MSTFVASVLDVDIWLQPRQDDLWRLVDESPFTDLGYGGRRGGGKSGGMRRILILRRLKYNRTNGLILRRTYDELYKNHLEPLLREFPYMRRWWHEGHKELRFPNGSKLYFGYAEHTVDVEKLVGSEFGDICVEEAGLFSEKELQMLKGSCRWTGYVPTAKAPRFIPKMLYSFMPGGRSHFYLKRIFVDHEYLPTEDPKRYSFLEAYGWDNIEWCRQELQTRGLTEKDFYNWTEEERKQCFLRSEYGMQLSSLTDSTLRDAWLEGRWDKFEGIVFPELSEHIHDLDRFAFPYVPSNCKLVSAIDWADSGTVGAVQACIDTAENMIVPEDYAETNKLVSEHSTNLTKLLSGYGRQEYTLMDLPETNINQADLFSIQDAFRRAGLSTVQAHRASIGVGLNLLKEYLRVDPNRVHPFTGQLGSPRLFISRKRAPTLWKQMKELQRVIDTETGKIKYIGSDDVLDPARYIAMSRPIAPELIKDLTPGAILQQGQHYTSIGAKAARSFGRFDKTFGKDPNSNEWFPKAN